MIFIKEGRDGAPSEHRTSTFTGTVWGDPVLPATDGVSINSVSFAPGARTHWHAHEAGQVLVVTSGGGLVYDRDGDGGRIRTGDVVFIPPGVEHWHGAAEDSYLVHLAISLKAVDWRQPVTDDEYRAPREAS